MTNEQQIKAVADAIGEALFITHGFASSQPIREAAQAAITAMGEVNAHIPHSSAPCVKDDNLASPAMQVREMTVEDVYSVIYDALLLDPRGCADNLGTDAEIITDALAKLGTIRIVEK